MGQSQTMHVRRQDEVDLQSDPNFCRGGEICKKQSRLSGLHIITSSLSQFFLESLTINFQPLATVPHTWFYSLLSIFIGTSALLQTSRLAFPLIDIVVKGRFFAFDLKFCYVLLLKMEKELEGERKDPLRLSIFTKYYLYFAISIRFEHE